MAKWKSKNEYGHWTDRMADVARKLLASSILLLIISSAGIVSLHDSRSNDIIAEKEYVIIELENPNDIVRIREMGVRIVEPYGYFVMAEVDADQRLDLERDGFIVTPMRNRTTIGQAYGSFDTSNGEPPIPPNLKITYPPGTEGYYIVQFIGPLKRDWIDELGGLGPEVVGYIPYNAYIVRMDDGEMRMAEKLRFVQWIGLYQPAYKISPIFKYLDGIAEMTVTTFREKDLQEVARDISSLGGRILHVEGTPLGGTIGVQMDTTKVADIARILEVSHIEPMSQLESANDRASWVVQSNVVNSRPVFDNGITGEGQIITVADGGLNVSHEMFYDPLNDLKLGHGIILDFDGSSWSESTKVDTSSSLFGVSMINEAFGFAVGYCSKILQYDGLSWTRKPSPIASNLNAVSMVDMNTGFAASANGEIIRYDGIDWSKEPNPHIGPLFDISMANDTTGIAVSWEGFLLYRNGTSWLVNNVGDWTNLHGASMVKNTTEGWVVGQFATHQIFHTADGGITWSPQGQSQYQYPLRDVDFYDVNTGVAVGDGTIIYTYDGGANWLNSTGADPGRTYHGVSMLNAMEGWVVGEEGTILHTSDGGISWTSQPSGTRKTLYHVDAVNPSNVVAVGEAVYVPNPAHRKIHMYFSSPSGDYKGSDHGTHVPGTVAGDAPEGGSYQTYNNYDGMAYGARLIIYDMHKNLTGYENLGAPSNYSRMYQPAYDEGSRIQTNSWGTSAFKMLWTYNPEYSSKTAQVDGYAWTKKDFLIVHGMGNDYGERDFFGNQYFLTTLTDHAQAKNIISVGATGNGAKAENVSAFSSRGPASDGRLKPTVVAPGQEVYSAEEGTIAGYVPRNGTSVSTPVVAGAAALIRQYFGDGWYPNGFKNPSDAFEPSSAMIKAMLINGAEEISGSGTHDNPYNGMAYPNNDQGWGRVNLNNSLFFAGETRGLQVIDNKQGLSTGNSIEYTLEVGSNEPLEVTLAWTDPPGMPNANPELVNDLDLAVTDPNGVQYKGNVFSGSSPGQSVSGGLYDALNVEECVLRLAPIYGTWTIKIMARSVDPMHGPQPYALVVTGNISSLKGPAVDYIKIANTPNASALEIPDQAVPSGFTITGHAVAYNYTAGYLYEISSNWSVSNFGSTATTSPSKGSSSVFDAGMKPGTAIWMADDGCGHADTVIFTITADIAPPTIEEVSATPSPQYIGDYVDISANVTDDSGQVTVKVRITKPDGSDLDNYTMTYDASTAKYHFEMTYNILGTYSFTIWANDSSGNWNSSSGSFETQPKYGSIEGTVVDENGKRISGAMVVLVNISGNTVATRNTDDEGNYTFDDMMPGTYSIHVSKSGYTDSTKGGVNVVAGDITTVDLIIITEEKRSSFLEDYWWILVVLIVLIVLIPVFLLLTKRKRKEEPVEAIPGETEEVTELPQEEITM